MRLPMSTIAGRRPNASGQMITPGMRSGRRMDERRVAGAVRRLHVDVVHRHRQLGGETRCSQSPATRPAASDSATKSRRERSFFSSAMALLLLDRSRDFLGASDLEELPTKHLNDQAG